MKEKEINLLLGTHGDHVRRYDLMIPNCYITNDNECDLLAIRKSGLVDEFEIKRTRSDFLADRKKRVRNGEPYSGKWEDRNNQNCSWTTNKLEWLESGLSPVNYFWYVTLEGIVKVEDLPVFSGWIEVTDAGLLRFKRSPYKLSNTKMDFETRYKLARKVCYRYWDMRRKQGE